PVARATYTLDYPTPDAAEVPAERLWEAVLAAAREGASGVDGIEGIGLSCLTPLLALLDKADQPVGPFWTHLDRRARMEARQVWTTVGEEFLTTVGNRPLPGGITAICYKHQLNVDPYLGHNVHRYLHANGWLSLRLTGQTAFDRGNACFSGLYGTL